MVCIAGGWINDEVTVILKGCADVKFRPQTIHGVSKSKIYSCDLEYRSRPVHGTVTVNVLSGDEDSTEAVFASYYCERGTLGDVTVHRGSMPICNESFKTAAAEGWKKFTERDKNETAAMHEGTHRRTGEGDGNE